jgi:hypothetical protein
MATASCSSSACRNSRTVTTSALDEDPGKVIVGMADINTPIVMPRKDEVYASVTISGSPVTKKSATATVSALRGRLAADVLRALRLFRPQHGAALRTGLTFR